MHDVEQGTEEWLRLRRQCWVTASQTANALGIGYNSRGWLYRRKTAEEPPVQDNTAFINFGTLYEDYVVELYASLLNREVRITRRGFGVHPEHEWLGASPDRVVEDVQTGEVWLLEAKTRPSGTPHVTVPISHICQMIVQCEVFGIPRCHWICWTPGEAVQLAEMTYTRELWSETIRPSLQFFSECCEHRRPPPRMPPGLKDGLIRAIVDQTSITVPETLK